MKRRILVAVIVSMVVLGAVGSASADSPTTVGIPVPNTVGCGDETVCSDPGYIYKAQNTHTGSGYGLFGWHSATTGTGAGVYGHSDSMANGAPGVLGYASAATGTTYGVYGISNSTAGRGVYGYGGATSGTNSGVYGQSLSTSGRGLVGYASAATGTTYGVLGAANSPSGWPGMFVSSAGNGVYISTPSGKSGLNVASGTKNAVVATDDGARLLYAEESSEVWFSDYGSGQLHDGLVWIPIDPVYAQTVNLSQPYHVFLQVYGDPRTQLSVSQRTPEGFEVRSSGGDPLAAFSYRLVAKRLAHEDVRLERAPWADDDPNLYPDRAADWLARESIGLEDAAQELPRRVAEAEQDAYENANRVQIQMNRPPEDGQLPAQPELKTERPDPVQGD